MDEHAIAGGSISATVRALGAEPVSLRHAVAGEVLWQAGPAWPKHAPILFPIVGELTRGRFRHEGRDYALGRHGFARERAFTWLERSATSCALVLTDHAETRERYPFRFELEIRYAADGDTLTIRYVVRNPGDVALPASLGAHPAFRWPLRDGVARDTHELVFERDEPERVRRLSDGLLDPAPFPTPIDGRVLHLDPSLFDADAIVMDRPQSTSVRYTAPGTPSLEVAWTGFAQLGLWSKRGGDFLCIEPWYGYASPVGFDGDLAQKPGVMLVAPGDARNFEIRITVRPPA